MDVALSTVDSALGERLRAVLEAASHRVLPFAAGDDVPRDVPLAIVQGLDQVIEACDAPCHLLALVTLDELDLFPECPRDVLDFVLEPFHPREVLARVEAAAELPTRDQQAHQQLLAAGVELSGDIFAIATMDLVVEHTNAAWEARLGGSAEAAVGTRLLDALTPEDPAGLEAAVGARVAWEGVLLGRATDGRALQFEATLTPVLLFKGELSHYACVLRDVTERLERGRVLVEANRALARARDAAVAASRAKSEFLANMSHELRTPLNAIIGYSEMLLEVHEDDEQTQSDLTRVRSAGVHLLGLINDVLDLSKIEANRVDLHPQIFPLRALLEEIEAAVGPAAAANENQLEVSAGEGVGEFRADRLRLKQVLLNLLGNACKFTRQGRVSLRAERPDGPRGEMVFIVSDTGIGISEEQQSRLFQPFVQADSSTTREFGGTGLGLAISKRLVELMDGSIVLESVLGAGSTFTVRVPEPRSDRAPSVAPARPGGPSVLLIDDDPDIRDLFGRVMGEHGFAVYTASRGVEGVALATTLQPDAIVLDVKMPGMDGWEVLSTLKLEPATQAIPVIMLTVLHQQDIGRALGAVDYLLKPVEPEALVAALGRHTSKRPARVLLVEDDEATRDLMRRTLEKDGHHVREACHGEEALATLAECPTDIVVLDLMMPVMDGFAFLHHIRGSAEHRDLPVIVATARSLASGELEELEAMAQRVLQKNAHTRAELLAMIGDHVRSMAPVTDG